MELFKQEMELFPPLPDFWSKNLFYKMSLIFTSEFIIDFQNRKWNQPNRKWNYFSHFRASDQKTSFTQCFTFFPRSLRLIFKTGKGKNWFSHFPSTKYVQCPLDMKKVSSSLAVRLIKSRKRHKFRISLRRKFENSNLLAEDFPLFPCLHYFEKGRCTVHISLNQLLPNSERIVLTVWNPTNKYNGQTMS